MARSLRRNVIVWSSSSPMPGEGSLRLLNLLGRVTDIGFILATVIGIITLLGIVGTVWFLLVS